jgi:hypothetical protein
MSAAAAARGNPYLQVRLPQETHDRLKEVVGEGDGGKAGGVSLFVRRLIYRELGEPVPKQWGKDDAELNDLINVAKDLDKWERDGFEPKAAVSLFEALRAEAANGKDLVIRNYATALLGRLTIVLMSKGTLRLEKP